MAPSSSRPSLLFLHHPPFGTGIEHMDVQNLRNAEALAALVGKPRGCGWLRPGMSTAPHSRCLRALPQLYAQRQIMPLRSISVRACRRRSRSSRPRFTCTHGSGTANSAVSSLTLCRSVISTGRIHSSAPAENCFSACERVPVLWVRKKVQAWRLIPTLPRQLSCILDLQT